MKRAVRALLARLGYKLVHAGVAPDMVEPGFAEVYRASAPFSMGTNERLYTLYKAVQYLEDRGVPGAIVECGVWRGGSAMAAALTLVGSGRTERAIYLYDTFAGMTEPGARDVDFQGRGRPGGGCAAATRTSGAWPTWRR